MREYDDHIRLHKPYLRRIIIFLVVLTAVPVMLWTITAFLRSYVGQPHLPTFRPMAATTMIAAPDGAAAANDTEQARLPESSRPVVEARATATDARSGPMDLIRNPSGADQPPDANASAPAGGSQVATATGLAPAAAPMPAVARPAASPMAATPAGTAGNTVWPAPPRFSPGGAEAAPSSPPPAADQAAGDALPPGEPIAGPIPLPRHRPRLFAMVQTGIPVPRPRPADAPEATSSTSETVPFWKLFNFGHQDSGSH